MRVGYARVSTDEQTTDLQYDALKRAGCDTIYQDMVTGTARRRPGLDKALKAVGPGDQLVVWRLDRAGRSLRHLMDIADALRAKDAEFVSLTEHIDTSTSVGELFFHILAALAQFERKLIVERTVAGLDAARARGAQLGRRRKLSSAQIAELGRLGRSGVPADALAHQFGVGRATLYRHGFRRGANEGRTRHA